MLIIMKKIILFLVFIFCLIFTSIIKNNTRSIEKDLLKLRSDILKINLQLDEANLELEYLTSPENIKILASTYFDDNFQYYKASDIKKLELLIQNN